MTTTRYSFELRYRCLDNETPDTRPVDALPSCIYPQIDNVADREALIARATNEMRAGGYRVEQITRIDACGRCDGDGTIGVLPRGRKRGTVPRWMLKRVECPACHGQAPRTVIVEEVSA